jgi:hypothetical protein
MDHAMTQLNLRNNAYAASPVGESKRASRIHGSKKWATFSEEKVAVAVAAVRIYSPIGGFGLVPF